MEHALAAGTFGVTRWAYGVARAMSQRSTAGPVGASHRVRAIARIEIHADAAIHGAAAIRAQVQRQ